MPRQPAAADDYSVLQQLEFRKYQKLQIESPEPGLDVVTLSQPPMNPLSDQMFLELAHYFQRLRTDLSVRVVIIRAEGKAFCAGLDLKEQSGTDGVGSQPPEALKVDPVLQLQRRVSDVIRQMRACPQPIVCCIQGAAAGGGFGLALASDVRLCTNAARFNVAMIRIGLSGCDIGISYHLPRLVGASTASEFILTGRQMSSDRALRCGLVSAVYQTQAQMDEAARTLAADMLSNSAIGLRYSKETLNQNIDAPSLDAALLLEDRTQNVIAISNADDIQMRMNSFVGPNRNKRPISKL